MMIYMLTAIVLMNMLVIFVAAYPYIAPLLQGVFVDPVYAAFSVGLIIIAIGLYWTVRRNA